MTTPANPHGTKEDTARCICTRDCPLTEDKHYINCPAHTYYNPAYFRKDTDMETLVEVSQADRDAAASLYAEFTVYADRDERSAVFRRGEMDSSEFVQAFARHRLNAERLSSPTEMREARALQLNGRDIYEVANQLDGYPDIETPHELAEFLRREAIAATELANEIVRLRAALERSPKDG